jgi:hypothetical protein
VDTEQNVMSPRWCFSVAHTLRLVIKLE